MKLDNPIALTSSIRIDFFCPLIFLLILGKFKGFHDKCSANICNKFIVLVSTAYHAISRVAGIRAERAIRTSFHLTGPQSALARTWEIGSSALWVMILLAVCLVLYYV